MIVKITNGMGNDAEIKIDSEKLTGKEILEKLDISLFAAVIEKNNVIVSENEI
jgi:sulfur carrier protein ThiS